MKTELPKQLYTPFVLLNISDLHFSTDAKSRKTFDLVFKSFVKMLNQFINDHKAFTPNCLAIIGDIANRGTNEEYQGVKSYVELLISSIEHRPEIFVVPGNHDKHIPDSFKKEHSRYVSQLMEAFDFCAKNKKPININSLEIAKCSISQYQKLYFGPYSDFVKEYNERLIPPFLDNKNYNNITGIRLLDSLRLCVVLLNTEWNYMAKENIIRKLSVGDSIIQQIEKQVETYREHGYFVITLMHRSPYYLEWKEIYDSDLKKSAFDRIVNMSDLIICGHEHNRQLKRPDFLLNTTQLFQNGSIYAEPNMESRDDRFHYSASLLYIDPNKRLVSTIRFNYDTDSSDYKWKTPILKERETFMLDPISFKPISKSQALPGLYKTISLKYPENDTLIANMCKRLFYSYDKNNLDALNIPTSIHVMVININCIHSINQEISNSENKTAQTHHIILYEKVHYTLNDTKKKEYEIQALNKYACIKNSIKHQDKDIKIVTNLVFCKILYGLLDNENINI